MREFKCENGKTYEVPDKCCLTCKHCTDIWYDYTNGPYATFCSKGWLPASDGQCTKWEDDQT